MRYCIHSRIVRDGDIWLQLAAVGHPAPPRGGFITVWNNVFACLQPDSNFGQPTSLSRRVCVRVLPIVAPSIKSEGARDAGVPKNPRTSTRRRIEAFRKILRRFVFSPTSRARCLRLAPCIPRWTTLLPTAVGPLRPPAGWRRGTAIASKDPVTRSWRIGNSRLGPPRVGCACCTLARPPRAGPA